MRLVLRDGQPEGPAGPAHGGQTLTWWSWAPLQDSLKESHGITFMLRKDPSGFCVDDGMEGVTRERGIHPGRSEKAKLRQRQWALLLLLLKWWPWAKG